MKAQNEIIHRWEDIAYHDYIPLYASENSLLSLFYFWRIKL